MNLLVKEVSRRIFLRGLGKGVAFAGALSRLVPLVSAQEATGSFLERMGKHADLIVHNDRPGVLETPIDLLRRNRITPKELLFVRNNQVLEGGLSLAPLPLEDWTIEVIGMVAYPRTVSGRELAGYDQSEVEMVLQCSGNGRALYAGSVRTRGTQWQKGGMGNVGWKGVSLKNLLEALKVGPHPGVRFLTAEGRDRPAAAGPADFEHSLPWEDVLERGLVALEMNGEPIPAVHGGPVRLVVPGYYGTMNIKWLSRLRLEAHESTNYNHVPRYRTMNRSIEPGSTPEITLENSSPTGPQRVKSIIWDPLEGESVDRAGFEVSGVAWNDGSVRIESVEVSVDHGRSWRQADLEAPSSPYAWAHWTARVSLPPGEREIWSRAVDALGRTQPLDGSIHWNPSGYEWSGVDRVRVAD